MNGYITEKAMQALKKYDQAEVYVSETVVNTVYIDNSKISNVETKTDKGMMFRMTKDGRMGKASVTLNGPGAEEDCLSMADSVLQFSPVNHDMNPYVFPRSAKISVPDVFDRKVAEITPDVLRELAKGVIDNCSVNIPRAQIRVSTTSSHVMNSNGVDVSHSSTLVYGHFTSMTVRDHPGEGIDTFHGTHLTLDPAHIGKELSRKANDAAVCTGFKGTEQMTMILPPGELGDMLFSSVGDAIDGENVKYGRSMWKDSVDSPVASEKLTITDDPTVPAPLSCAFDDEGQPTQKRPVLEDGVLRGFLRDSFCGASTGNGMRRSSVEAQGAYERTPVIKPLNLVVKPGNLTREQIIEQTERGILVEKFASPEADGLTGRFGLNVRCGYIVRNGEITGVVNNALLMGNMFDCVKNVDLIGCDSTQMGVITVPTMSFTGTELVGN